MAPKEQKSKQSFWIAKKGWILSTTIPFVCFFAIGAKFGYWVIEKDVGRILRDTGRIVPDSDLYLSALLFGTILGLGGALIGALLFGLIRLGLNLLKSKH